MASPTQGSNAPAGGGRLALNPDRYTTLDALLEYNKPGNQDLLIQSFGDQGITGFLKLTGSIRSGGTSDNIQYWEEERRHKIQAVDNIAVDGAGSGVFSEIDAGAAADVIVRTNDVIMDTTNGNMFLVVADGETFIGPCVAVQSNADRFNVVPLGFVASSAYTALSTAGAVVVGNMFAQGTDQPSKFNKTAPIKRTNSYMIVKEKYAVNGSQATNIGYVNVGNGDYRWYIHGENETRQRFMDKREMMMLFGEKTGTGLQGSGNEGITGSEGYFAAVADRGITVGTSATDFMNTFTEFDDLIVELDKQGAPAEYAMYLNRKQSLAIDDMLASGIATQVTAGLPGQFGAFNNDADMAVKLGFKSFTRGGYTFHKHDWKLLNDPTLLGASSVYAGAMVPLSKVADANTGAKAHALEMLYKEANGYSRELDHWVRGGGVLGHANMTEDVAEFHYRSECALVTRAANQHVILKG